MPETRQPPPVLDHEPQDAALLAHAFWLLLDHGRPVDIGELAAGLGRDPAGVAAALGRLAQAGRVRRDPAGQVVGSHGLSVQPTRHQLLLDGEQRWTWCAWDAVGILGALGASGQVRSASPHGVPIELAFDTGRPPDAEVVVFLAADQGCDSVVDDWCPLVNLFQYAQAAAAWAESHRVAGTVLPLQEATAKGAAAWRAWLGTRPGRTDAYQA